MNGQIVILVALVSAACAAPTDYQTGAVQHPPTGEYGYLDSLVAETVNILPEITSVFGRVTGAGRSADPAHVQNVMMEFIPLTRRVMMSTENVGDRQFSSGEWQRFNAAEAVMPSVITFMDSLRNMDFFGVAPVVRTVTSK
ncbi:uncharacterized protein [Macrobrachium rosenbergii]|uniref:uncharacterized protein n=1 Tax=Macrobrachium rosenbergii TaxID=79674 RepID=UPI0034D47013